MFLICLILFSSQHSSIYRNVKKLILEDSMKLETNPEARDFLMDKYVEIGERLLNLENEKPLTKSYFFGLFKIKSKTEFSDEIKSLAKELEKFFYKRFTMRQISQVCFKEELDDALTQKNTFNSKRDVNYRVFLQVLTVIIEEEDKNNR